MRPTVHDIALAAGVSLATVDRVLNRRPGVRPETRARVEQAIERLGFVRDVAAANLAKSRTYPITFIVPDGNNSFMAGLRDEVVAAQTRSRLERTDIALIAVPAFDGPALTGVLERLAENPPAGIAMVAVDSPDVIDATRKLRQGGVWVTTLVSDLPVAERDHFAGVDNLAAGRTAGGLLGRFCGNVSGTVGILAGSMKVGDHRERLTGFRQRMNTVAPRLQLLEVMESQDEPDEVYRLSSQMLEGFPDLVGIYNLGAGNRGLIRALERWRGRRLLPRVVVHELTPHTRRAIDDELIDAVLNQDPGHEVRSAIRVLKAKADGLGVIPDQERIRIDIFLKDNLP